jgi:hypothetical protein
MQRKRTFSLPETFDCNANISPSFYPTKDHDSISRWLLLGPVIEYRGHEVEIDDNSIVQQSKPMNKPRRILG